MSNNRMVNFYSRERFKAIIKIAPNLDSKRVCIVSISDTYEESVEMKNLLDEYLPLTNRIVQFFRDADSTELGCINKKQASDLYNFIKTKDNCDLFLIHCYAGISRSAAIAKFINDYHGIGMNNLNNYMLYNKYIYRELYDLYMDDMYGT